MLKLLITLLNLVYVSIWYILNIVSCAFDHCTFVKKLQYKLQIIIIIIISVIVNYYYNNIMLQKLVITIQVMYTCMYNTWYICAHESLLNSRWK